MSEDMIKTVKDDRKGRHENDWKNVELSNMETGSVDDAR